MAKITGAGGLGGDNLVLPNSPEVKKEVRDGGCLITFLEVAVGILDRLSETLNEIQKDEVRFVRDCLQAGPDATQVPCMMGDTTDSVDDEARAKDTKVRGNIRQTFSRLRSEVGSDYGEHTKENGAGSRGEDDTTTKSEMTEELKSAEKLKDKPKRPNSHLRGGLHASQSAGNIDKAMDVGMFNGGVPWMGPVVSRWPPNSPLADADRVSVEAIFFDSVNRWEMDIFRVHELTLGMPLLHVGWEILQRSGVFSEFAMTPAKAAAFLKAAEAKYEPDGEVSYHNNVHAADVAQTVWATIMDLGVNAFFDPMDRFTSLMAAIIHDMGHDGRTNAFHVNIQDRLAIRYNDRSVLENFHVATGFRLMLVNKGTNFLEFMPKVQLAVFRREVIDMVLSTDMTQHFSKLAEFGEHAKVFGQEPEDWQGNDVAMHALRALLLHAADISNQAKPMHMASAWTARCLNEFFSQGDMERQLGVPVSPLCDRDATEIPESQVGFIQFIVQPTWESVARVLPNVRTVCVTQVERNLQDWKKMTGIVKSLDQLAGREWRRSSTAGQNGNGLEKRNGKTAPRPTLELKTKVSQNRLATVDKCKLMSALADLKTSTHMDSDEESVFSI
eukprot:TRINITY_DN17942_c0_g3_i1.p1 TRINITY_DN17942_c0_g3~~TRINITY_DN17942_c0_g3_i1.p1  ORF type:complete len:613 (+),score=142.42 TRINITY_DN17942_c0_g3_i1:134-1972(+)